MNNYEFTSIIMLAIQSAIFLFTAIIALYIGHKQIDITDKLSHIEEYRAEVGIDCDGAYYEFHVVSDRIEAAKQEGIKQERASVLKEMLGLIEKHDPNVRMNRTTNPIYWGNTLRKEIKQEISLLEKVINNQ